MCYFLCFFICHLQFWFMFSCTLRMSHCLWDFFPSVLLFFFVCFINKNRIAVIDMKLDVSVRVCVDERVREICCQCPIVVVVVFVVVIMMHNHPIHIIQMRILFIKVESIHFSLMVVLCLCLSLQLWFITIPFNKPDISCSQRKQKVNKSTENGKNAPVGPKWSILDH